MLYRLCKRYVLAYDNDNQDDMDVNGELRLLRDIVPRAKTVFDVGANLGRWTRAALKINPHLRVHCFEPSNATFESLLANHFPAQVACNHFALGEHAGQAALYTVDDCSGVNSLYRREVEGFRSDKTETVSVRTLDEYCSEHGIEQIDLLKIDVEGHELAVLRGSREMLRQGKISAIQFEYGGTYLDARVLLRDVWDYINSVAPRYAFHKLYPNGPKLIPVYQETLETFQMSNWVIQRAA
jgi:FkbM family methyltransferase